MAVHTLTIPNWRPVRLNVLLKAHHYTKTRLKRADAEMVALYALKLRIPEAKCRRRVDLHLVPGAGQSECDADAFWKSGLDALTRAGLLVDDRPKWCLHGKVTQGSRAKDGPPRTVFTLTDLED
jgi:hypothetical protein